MEVSVFWFRRDLRLTDNVGLYHALNSGVPVLPVFIFDKNILDKLTNPQDARVGFIYKTLVSISAALQIEGSDIDIRYGDPFDVWRSILKDYNVKAVYANHDYEPYAISRDEAVKNLLQAEGVTFHTYKDHVIFEKDEVVKDDGKPYTVFTPYKKKWMEKLASTGEQLIASAYLRAYDSEKFVSQFVRISPLVTKPSLQAMGFSDSEIPIPSNSVSQALIRTYDQTRDYPALNGTSKLGIHFRFGTISIREKTKKALALNTTFLNELIWRDFYAMILYHFPHVEKGAFRPEYERIVWRNNEAEFKRWCAGKTGYAIVDAGMRELSQTGYMHNRVRMITASFLTKHLLIDWRWGEAWFAEKLLDFDLASNNGGWQWAAGCGTDAAPYFRIFSPDAQTEKFDKQHAYIKKWVPEYGTAHYVKPIVDHKFARQRCLETYKQALAGT